MKKAFKSSTVQDQQVVSKNSIPNPVADIYNQSDKPPPLSILTPYRYGVASRVPRAAKPGAVDSCQSGLETVKTGIAESHTVTLAIAAEPFSLRLSKYG